MVDAAVRHSTFQHCCVSRNCLCIFTSKTYTSALHLVWSCTESESGNGLDGYILGDTDRTLPSGENGMGTGDTYDCYESKGNFADVFSDSALEVASAVIEEHCLGQLLIWIVI